MFESNFQNSQSQLDSLNLYQDSIFTAQTHQFPDPFLHLHEQFDADKLAYIIDHFDNFKDLILSSSQSDDNDDRTNYNPLNLLEKYLQRSRHGSINTIFYQSEKRGRMFASGQISLQGMTRTVRHTIASPFYIDIDMKNAHPIILKFLCDKDNVPCPYLNQYIENRETLLANVGLERDAAKNLYLSLTNGGNKDYRKVESPNRHLKGYKKEMHQLHQHFATENPILFEQVKQKRILKNKDYNHEAALTNVLLCDVENEILMAMYNFFGKPKSAVLCFDGIMLPKNGDNHYDLGGCVTHVKQTIGIDIELSLKPMNEILPLPDNIPSYQYPSLEYYGDFVKLVELQRISFDWVNEWSYNSLILIENGGNPFFLTKNQKIEEFRSSPCGDRPSPITRDEWLPKKLPDVKESLKVCCNIRNPFYHSSVAAKYQNNIKNSNPKKAYNELSQLEKIQIQPYSYTTLGCNSSHGLGYLSDLMDYRKIQCFNNVIFFPFLSKKGVPSLPGSFNLFTGFPLEKTATISDTTDQLTFEDSKFYKHLQSEFFNNDIGELNHFLDHMADIIQDPANIKGTGHLFYSQQGTGKGLLGKFVSKMLGPSNVVSIINTDIYFDKNFNSDRANKLLKIFEEVSEKGSAFKNHNRLKGEQTSPRERIENKGVDAFTTLHCARFWFFTNNENSLYIESDDRRQTMHKINNRKANDYDYFKPLWEEIEDPNFLHSAFQFLANRQYDMKNVLNSYDTPYKREQKIVNVPNGIKFMIDYVQSTYDKVEDRNQKLESLVLRQAYKKWCENRGCPYHLESFHTQIHKLGIDKPKQVRVKGVKHKCYGLNTASLEVKIREYLKDLSWTFDFGEETNDEIIAPTFTILLEDSL